MARNREEMRRGQGQGQQGQQGTNKDDDMSSDTGTRSDDSSSGRRGGAGNFAEDPGRASEAGRKGGMSRSR